MQEPMVNPMEQIIAPTSFEVPLTNPQPEVETPVVSSQLEQLQGFLNANGYTYKTYGNDTNDCIIIELPRN